MAETYRLDLDELIARAEILDGVIQRNFETRRGSRSMSVSHHGDQSANEDLRNIERLLAQIEGTARREYPAGRMGAEDDGALSLAIAADPQTQTLIIRFGKPVEWIGLGPADVAGLIEQLVTGYRQIATEPLALRL